MLGFTMFLALMTFWFGLMIFGAVYFGRKLWALPAVRTKALSLGVEFGRQMVAKYGQQ